jgi:hypothetical protein
MNIIELRKKLRYDIEHPKCKRCGKELHIPQPPKEKQQAWGIFAWTAFVKQYAKHHGWYELDNLNKNIVCDNCLLSTDVLNTIMLKNYDDWERKYNEWKTNESK